VPPGYTADDVPIYTYDPATGRKVADAFRFNYRGEHSSYGYDALGRLDTATIRGATTTYDYDPGSGSMTEYRRSGETTVTLAYDEATGRLKQAGSRLYAYDAAGRRTSEAESGSATDTVYAWSSERLVRYTAPGVEASFAYDAAGQRVRSVVAQGSLTTTSTYAYEGLTLLSYAAMRSDGATWTVDYLTDERGVVFAGVYASSDTSAAVPFLAVTTDRGDVRELVDTQGAAFCHYAYDAYGSPTETTSTATSLLPAPVASAIAERSILRYAGYAFDDFSGLYYCSQRYYDPETVSFVSKDPAKADGEESAYQYCGGDPVGKVDPSGLTATVSAKGSNASVRGYAPGLIGFYQPISFKIKAWFSGKSGVPVTQVLVSYKTTMNMFALDAFGHSPVKRIDFTVWANGMKIAKVAGTAKQNGRWHKVKAIPYIRATRPRTVRVVATPVAQGAIRWCEIVAGVAVVKNPYVGPCVRCN
jgi:RHS repeat-associated protein